MAAGDAQLACAADLAALGLAPGDAVLVHAALRKVGPVVGGADDDHRRAARCGRPGGHDPRLLPTGSCEDDVCATTRRCATHIPPFDPQTLARDPRQWLLSRTAAHDARRAAQRQPRRLLAAHRRPRRMVHRRPCARLRLWPAIAARQLVEAGGKMLMLGAPLDTMTLLHHAEHLADFPDKRIRRYEAPILVDGKTVWRLVRGVRHVRSAGRPCRRLFRDDRRGLPRHRPGQARHDRRGEPSVLVRRRPQIVAFGGASGSEALGWRSAVARR